MQAIIDRLTSTAENSNLPAEQYGAFCTPSRSGDAAGSSHYALQYRSPAGTQNTTYKACNLNTDLHI